MIHPACVEHSCKLQGSVTLSTAAAAELHCAATQDIDQPVAQKLMICQAACWFRTYGYFQRL